MIKEAYVSFEVAKLLKEKGFDEDTIGYYNSIAEIPERIKFFDSPISIYNSDGLIGCIQAPTLQMAMKWLREVHHIFIEIHASIDLNGKYHFSYSILDKECRYIRRGFINCDRNYEQTIEAALKYILEDLI